MLLPVWECSLTLSTRHSHGTSHCLFLLSTTATLAELSRDFRDGVLRGIRLLSVPFGFQSARGSRKLWLRTLRVCAGVKIILPTLEEVKLPDTPTVPAAEPVLTWAQRHRLLALKWKMSAPGPVSAHCFSVALSPSVVAAHQGASFSPLPGLSAVSHVRSLSCHPYAASVPSVALKSVSQLSDVPTWMSHQKLKSEMDTQLPPNLSPQPALSRCLWNRMEPWNTHFHGLFHWFIQRTMVKFLRSARVGWITAPPKIPPPKTCECELIWKKRPCRGN